MSNPVKVLRGQVRQVVQEVLPDVLASEVYAKLKVEIEARLEVIAKEIRETLTRIEARTKDQQDLILREINSHIEAQLRAASDVKASPTTDVPAEAKPE